MPELRQHLLSLGIAPLLGFRDAMEALSVAVRVGRIIQAKKDQSAPADLPKLDRGSADNSERILVDEFESKTKLRNFGLCTVDFRVAKKGKSAAVATEIGLQVALKLISDQVSHKKKIGGVKLALNTAQEVADAEDAIIESAIRLLEFRLTVSWLKA